MAAGKSDKKVFQSHNISEDIEDTAHVGGEVDTNKLGKLDVNKIDVKKISDFGQDQGACLHGTPELSEEARLKVLEDFKILDTPADPRFDRVTELGTLIFGLPICLVSLVDRHRQWFKSSRGLDVTFTDRCSSFCAYTVQSGTPKVLVVLDAFDDERFVNNPLVVHSPGIRFYAGAVLEDLASGHRLGNVCIIDTKPWNSFDKSKIQVLQCLASLCMQVCTPLPIPYVFSK
ncbi:hypothetical protein CYMTET_17224 [Cymbomonas tetramitiformis]|uniref:GAF domain-containing protein n=1 Tax=Cymbomonas tetramitiformis TaxID=36881 RepID=A0AAE0GB20_9CHLO|nr:hypothetical protein CYMTET_17224 [Cymbomonas tetramitiformis]